MYMGVTVVAQAGHTLAELTIQLGAGFSPFC